MALEIRAFIAANEFEVDVGHGKVVGVADDVGDVAIFLDGPWRCHGIIRYS